MNQNSAAATPDDSSYSLPDGRGRIAVVLGASGYMGSNVVPALAAHGWHVRATARNPAVLEALIND